MVVTAAPLFSPDAAGGHIEDKDVDESSGRAAVFWIFEAGCRVQGAGCRVQLPIQREGGFVFISIHSLYPGCDSNLLV